MCSWFVVVELPSRIPLFKTTWTAAGQASLSLTISKSLPQFMSIELVDLQCTTLVYILPPAPASDCSNPWAKTVPPAGLRKGSAAWRSLIWGATADVTQLRVALGTDEPPDVTSPCKWQPRSLLRGEARPYARPAVCHCAMRSGSTTLLLWMRKLPSLSGPQPSRHLGLISWNTVLPWTGVGGQGWLRGVWGMGSGRSLLTSCSSAWFLWVLGLGFGDPCPI